MATDRFGNPIDEEPSGAAVDRFGNPIDEPEEGLTDDRGRTEVERAWLKTELIAKDEADWRVLRDGVSKAKKKSALSGEPSTKYRALAKAQYLETRTHPGFGEELTEYKETGVIPGKMPGKKTPFYRAMDVADTFVSWGSRPTHSLLSAHADMDYIKKANPEDFGVWVENLHKDDPRRNIYREIKENFNERNREDDFVNPVLDTKLLGLRSMLAATYWVPNDADPYGGYGVPRPWQKIRAGGEVIGGPPATTADIWMRGLAAPASFGNIDTGPEGNTEAIHKEMQRLGSAGVGELAEGIKGVTGFAAGGIPGKMLADLALPEVFDRGYHAKKVEEAIQQGDPNAGLLLPTLFYTVGPDFLVPTGMVTRLGKEAFKTGGGLLTKAGDSSMYSTITRHQERMFGELEKAVQAGDKMEEANLSAYTNTLEELIKQAYSKIGDLASRGLRLGQDAPVEDVVGAALRKSGVTAPKKAREVVHINLDEALSFDGTTPKIDYSKIQVIYKDDYSVQRILQETKGKTVSKEVTDRASKELEKLIGRKKAKALFAKDKQLFNKALIGFGGAAGAATAYSATDEKDSMIKRASVAALGLALGSLPGVPVGQVIDDMGRSWLGKVHVNSEKVAFDGMTNDIDTLTSTGAVLADMQQSLPFLKRFKPWAVRIQRKGVDGADRDVWKPLQSSDLIDTHGWTRMEYLSKKMGFSRREMSSAINEVIGKVFSGKSWVTKKEKEILSHFVEALGAPTEYGDEAVSLFKALRFKLNEAVSWKPRARPAEEGAFWGRGFADVDDGVAELRGRALDDETIKRFDELSLDQESLDVIDDVMPAIEKIGRGWADKARRAAATGKKAPEYGHSSIQTIINKIPKKKDSPLAKKSPEEVKELVAKALGQLEEIGLVTRSGKNYRGDPKIWETWVHDVDIKGRTKARASAKPRTQMRKEVHSKPVSGMGMPKRARVDGAPVDMPPGAPGEKLLGENVAESIRSELERAEIVSKALRQITGVADVDELIEIGKLRNELDAALGSVKMAMSDEEFAKAVGKMTVGQARAASRAAARISAKHGPGVKKDPEFEALSEEMKDAVDAAREFFQEMYRVLKAEGLLQKDWSVDEFLERMQVEGYLHHMFTKEGSAKIAQMKKSLSRGHLGGGGGFGEISTASDVLKLRSRSGTIREVNEGVRRGIAEMFYRETVRQNKGLPNIPADQVIDDQIIQQVIKEHGLDQIKFFETDLFKIMDRYGRKVSRTVSNTRFIDNVLLMAPEGEQIAALVANYKPQAALSLAAKLGFRKVDNLHHMRAVLGEDYWSGWDKYAPQIKNITAQFSDEAVRKGKITEFLQKHGVSLDDERIKLNVERISRDIYLPYAYADMVEALGDSTWLHEKQQGSELWRIGVESFDNFLNFFKTMTTVYAPAFHGRNAISNVITNLMTHGLQAVSPVNQIDSFHLMTADLTRKAADGTEVANTYTLKSRTEGGQLVEITKTIQQWRSELRRYGIITDHINPSDIRGGKYGNDVNWKIPATTAAAGAVLGAGVGYSTEDDPDKRLVKAFAGALLGGGVGVVGSSFLEMYAKAPLAAYKAEKASVAGAVHRDPGLMENSKQAFSVAFDEWLDIVGYEARLGEGRLQQAAMAIIKSDAVKTGAWGAGAGGATGWMFPDPQEGGFGGQAASAFQTALYGFLGVAGTKAIGDASAILAGGVGRKVEEQAKIVNYLAGRKVGLSPDAASDLVHKTLFNYDDLSTFERHWLRRVFPFYTWTSKNASELQPWLLRNRPIQYSALTKLLDQAENSFTGKGDLSMLQDHHRYRAVVGAGLGKVFAGFGLPQEDLVDLFKFAESGGTGISMRPSGVISRLHPVVPFISKMFFGHDPYYNVDVDRIRSARDVRYLSEGIKRWVGYAEIPVPYMDSEGNQKFYTKYEVGWFPSNKSIEAGLPWDDSVLQENQEVGSRRLAAIRSFPAWRLATEWNKAVTDTFMGGVTAKTGQGATWGERGAAIFTGAKPYSIDWNRLEGYAHRRFEDNLDSVISNMGNMGQIDIFYKERSRPMGEYRALVEAGLIPQEGFPSGFFKGGK